MDPVIIQKQVRDNSEDLQDFLRDLSSWEKDMKRKERELKNEGKTDTKLPPVRSKIKRVEESKTKESGDQESNRLKRIPSHDYAAWDKFDVDKACAEVEPEEQEDKHSDTDSGSGDEELLEIERMKQQAQDEKEKGNIFFKKGQWDAAIECYSKAIQCDPFNAVYPANRAMALLKKEQYGAAEKDCTEALNLDPNYVKAYQRRATARTALENIRGACEDLEKVLELEPRNKAAANELKKLKSKLTAAEARLKEETERIVDTKADKEEINQKNEGKLKNIVKPIYKPPHLQSKKPLRRIPIEEVSDDENPIQRMVPKLAAQDGAKSGAGDASTSKDVEIELPPAPKTSVQFYIDLKKVRSDSKVAARYLSQIDGAIFPALLQDSLESDPLSDILQILSSEEYLTLGAPVCTYLVGLSQVRRFGALALFLSKADKDAVGKLLDVCKTRNECSSSFLDELRKKFEL